MKTRLIVLFCIVTLLLGSAVTLAQQNSIVIPSQAQVQTLNIRLSEIAKINGSAQFVNKVKQITLGQTPYPNYQRVIYRDDVIYALRQERINLAQVKIRIPYQFKVAADYRAGGVDRLVQQGRAYIKNKLNYKTDKLQIKVLDPPEELLLPQGKVSFEVVKNYNRRLLGVNMLPIKVLVDNSLYRKFYLKFSTKLKATVLRPKERLKTGQSLSPESFSKEERLLTKSPKDYISSKAELTDKVLTRTIATNQFLTADMIATPKLVNRWQEVKIRANVGGVVVTTTGKALENGRKGDIINVKNTSSSKKVEGKVVAPNQVEVVTN